MGKKTSDGKPIWNRPLYFREVIGYFVAKTAMQM